MELLYEGPSTHSSLAFAFSRLFLGDTTIGIFLQTSELLSVCIHFGSTSDVLGVDIDHDNFSRDRYQALELSRETDEVWSRVLYDEGCVSLVVSLVHCHSRTAWIIGMVIPSQSRMSSMYLKVLTTMLSM